MSSNTSLTTFACLFLLVFGSSIPLGTETSWSGLVSPAWADDGDDDDGDNDDDDGDDDDVGSGADGSDGRPTPQGNLSPARPQSAAPSRVPASLPRQVPAEIVVFDLASNDLQVLLTEGSSVIGVEQLPTLIREVTRIAVPGTLSHEDARDRVRACLGARCGLQPLLSV